MCTHQIIYQYPWYLYWCSAFHSFVLMYRILWPFLFMAVHIPPYDITSAHRKRVVYRGILIRKFKYRRQIKSWVIPRSTVIIKMMQLVVATPDQAHRLINRAGGYNGEGGFPLDALTQSTEQKTAWWRDGCRAEWCKNTILNLQVLQTNRKCPSTVNTRPGLKE